MKGVDALEVSYKMKLLLIYLLPLTLSAEIVPIGAGSYTTDRPADCKALPAEI